MSILNNLPSYAGLFGNIDFKEGDESRSVYSPAAYLTDLLQMLDDEFNASALDESRSDEELDYYKLDLDVRRGDIKNIDLDEENTTTLIPYLDIVNEVLEGRVNSDQETVYETLKTAQYPFNMPFSLNNEKIKNSIKHLGISAQELRRLFATDTDYHTVAREYLGLSVEELDAFVEIDSTTDEDKKTTSIVNAYGYTYDSTSATAAATLASFIDDMSSVSSYMETTDLDAQKMRELLYHNLYVDPSDHTIVESGRENFYINSGLTAASNSIYTSGYVTLSADEASLEWNTLIENADDAYTGSEPEESTDTLIPLAWFDRASRFIRLAQKTGLSFIELDNILRFCCKVDGVATLDDNTIITVAQIVYFHKKFEVPIDKVIAVLSTISYTGHTNEDLPKDQFNRIFNLPCVAVDKNYFHIADIMGDLPDQYEDTTYNDYTQIEYFNDLFSDDNDYYRKRLRHTLGYTDTDLINITERLEFEEIAESTLWESKDNEWALLNILYRIHALASMLDIGFLELFTMFDLLEQDPYVGRIDPHTYFVYGQTSTQNCFDILFKTDFDDDTDMETNIADRLWLLESLTALNKWMKEFGYSAEMLWKVVNGAPMTDDEEQQKIEQDLEMYNALLARFKVKKLKPDTFKKYLGDVRASRFIFNLLKSHCGHDHDNAIHQLMTYHVMDSYELAKDFIGQLDRIASNEFIDLSLEEKLQEKVFTNLVTREVIDGNGKILLEALPEYMNFQLENDFSHISEELFKLFHRIYMESDASRQNSDDEIDIQLFKSDLKELGLNELEARELYDTLIYKNYIDDQGYAQNVEMFSSDMGSLDLSCGLRAVTRQVYQHLVMQFKKFSASQVMIKGDMFEDLELDSVALDDLMKNLTMNRYIDEQGIVTDKMRLMSETPNTMNLALQFYPYREEIYKALERAISTNKDMYLKVDKNYLTEISAKTVSVWVVEDLQQNYIKKSSLSDDEKQFFTDESNKQQFTLRQYFDETKRTVIFDHIQSIIEYSNKYAIKDESLKELDFNESEIKEIKQLLMDANIINRSGVLNADDVEYFTSPENASDFNVPGFDDFDKEIFFLLYSIANEVDKTVKAIEKTIKKNAEKQESDILDHLQSVLGIDIDIVKLVSKAVFKVDDNLHHAWLMPLLKEANALNRLDSLPHDMHYTQAVKRIRQLAMLINKLQLDINEVDIAIKDQKLVDKFPEDLILPDGIISVDAILETEEFIYLFNGDYYWIYLAEDYRMIDKKEVVVGIEEDDDLIDLQKQDEARQKRLKEDPIRQLFDKEDLSQVDAAFIDKYGTWCIVSGEYHYVKYDEAEVWDRRDNTFGQVDNDFENIEMVDAAYVNPEGHLFLFANDKYVRYSEIDFTLDPSLKDTVSQISVDQGYPKSIADDWNNENQAIQLPVEFARDLGPLFDGLDGYSYAFFNDQYVSSQGRRVKLIADMWGHREHNFGRVEKIDAAMASQGNYLLFHNDKVVKYAGSIELDSLQPEEGYPRPIHEEFDSLPGEFVEGLDATLHGIDDNVYLFHDDECVTASYDEESSSYTVTSNAVKTKTLWGVLQNDIADNGKVDAAFVGLDGRTYLFSGSQYVRYSTNDYSMVDDGFPRDIVEDWEGLTEVTAAFVLDNKTYLFGTNVEQEAIYVRYSTLRKEEQDYLEVDEEDPNARVIETVLANRPDVDEIEVFPATVDAEFWSIPRNLIPDDVAEEDFQIDAVMNGPDNKVYLFYGDSYVEHDHANRWWSEPKVLAEQWDRIPSALLSEVAAPEGDGITETINQTIVAAMKGEDGYTYLFFENMYLRFSDKELRTIDNGFPRLTSKFWGNVRNNIESTGKVDATLLLESRWEEQNDDGQLEDMVEMHTYLFSGDQFFRYKASDYSQVEQGYPRSMSRLKDEPRFKGLEVEFSDGIDATFADQRQIYLFLDDSFYVVVGDEDNYKQYDDDVYANIQAVTQQEGLTYTLDVTGDWYKHNHLEDQTPKKTVATPRIAEKAQDKLSDNISAVLHGTNKKSYVFAGTEFYDVSLERNFNIVDVWGRSRNPIHDKETIDAAFVGRDGTTYVFSGHWFVQYETDTYTDQTVVYPPRRISDKWKGLKNVALAYVWKEETYLFERPDEHGNFSYLRYSKDSYEKPDRGFPRRASEGFWQIPEAFLAEGFNTIDAIFVHEDNLIFISDQKFISFDLEMRTWSHPQDLELIFEGIPFNKTDFSDLKSGFIGADDKVYFFNQQCFVSYDSSAEPDEMWSDVLYIKDHWGLQRNIFENGIDAAYVGTDGATYLFAGNEYVKYSSNDYRYVDESYPKEIATYLRDEPAFEFMTKEFQQHLDQMEAAEYTPFFTGIVDNGRCVYVFTEDTVFAGSPDKYIEYSIEGLGDVDNNFTRGGIVNAAFVDTEREYTYLFSGEQYIRYSGDSYRFIDDGYPKIIAESLADELAIDTLTEDYRNGIDAAFYHTSTGPVLFSERQYLYANDGAATEGNISDVWGKIDNEFINADDNTIDGAYVDSEGALRVFKGTQFVRYSDTMELFELNPYDEPRYVDEEYPQYITDQWPQIDDELLGGAGVDASGVDAVFKFEDEIYFHTDGYFSIYDVDLDDHDQEVPLQVLAYRWGEWSDYLLSDIHAITRFKDLGERFTGGDMSLTELVSGADGEVKEPYMQFAAIFGFEKEEVRWLKQRNGFLADQVNIIEEDFQLELVLKLYDILSTTQRIRVDVSPLYYDVWLNLYGQSDTLSLPNYSDAAAGSYDLLVSVDCDNNYETLVKQIDNELNTIKRDALVPYVIANDDDVSTTRALYQKLLIDIQMDSCAETSRIKEAIAAVQLYLHRYFVNLEDLDLNATDQDAARAELKERWDWLKNYRVWEANRKVFLYPENYIRPELRDTDTKSEGFKDLEDSLMQGELTEESVEEAYFKYLDAFTEVSELTIAGGYVYDDGDDKKLLLLGRTRTDPMRYFYRFGNFVGGDSDSAVWEPWQELDIPIEATRVEPVFAFNRVFIFWTTLEETAEDASEAEVTVSDEDPQTVSSEGNTTYEVKVFYSFYNLNKRWTQPQALQTEFNDSSALKNTTGFDNVELFVENTTKLTVASGEEHDYENIFISVRSEDASDQSTSMAAYNLTPELYSQEAEAQDIENRGQDLFEELFSEEGSIEDDNVVMLNYSANSVDGPWFAYNHNGCGFLVKPDAVSGSSDDELSEIDASSDDIFPDSTVTTSEITAAVQAGTDGDLVYFLKDGTYTTRSVAEDGTVSFTSPAAISSRWGLQTEMQETGLVDSAFVIGNFVLLTLNDDLYLYDYNDSSTETGIAAPDRLVKQSYEFSTLSRLIPSSWKAIGASCAINNKTYLFEKDSSAVAIWGSTQQEYALSALFGYNAGAATYYNRALHEINGSTYTVYNTDGSSSSSSDITVANVLKTMYGQTSVTGVVNDDYLTKGLMVVDGGVWIKGESVDGTSTFNNYIDQSGAKVGVAPSSFTAINDEWIAGLSYSNGSFKHQVTFTLNSDGSTTMYKLAIDTTGNTASSWSSATSSQRVTGAFEDTSGRIVIIVDHIYYQFFAPSSDANTMMAGLQSLNLLSTLGLNTPDNAFNAIGNSDEGIDAAFVGTANIATDEALYLFLGSEYFRYSYLSNGSYSKVADVGYPKTIASNSEGFPSWSSIDAAFSLPDNSVSYFFNNDDENKNETPIYYHTASDVESIPTKGIWGALSVTSLQVNELVDAAYATEDSLYLVSGDEYYRYGISSEGVIDDYISSDSPGALSDTDSVDGIFVLNDYAYFFTGNEYYRLSVDAQPSALSDASTISGSWGNLTADIRASGIDAAFTYAVTDSEGNVSNKLYFIQGDNYISYVVSDSSQASPYEIKDVNYEVIRLTSSTAEQLNQILFADGIDGLLKMSTQEIDESPTISFDTSTPENIYMNEDRFTKEPTNSHLDFHSANGIYYWEVFFHTPFLIAQALNADQKFEDAKKWYEYIFDPTEVSDYWKFLPFLAADPNALTSGLENDLDVIESLVSSDADLAYVSAARTRVENMAAVLAPYQDIFLGLVNKTIYEDGIEDEAKAADEDYVYGTLTLANIENWSEFDLLTKAISDLANITGANDEELLATRISEMQEVMEVMKKLDYRIDLMSNHTAQLSVYFEDPFDPHAIAALRVIAYRKAIVMRYIDNLLDWGDLLFRQYTRESINEARMLYILAYDILGEKPENMGKVVLEPTQSYNDFNFYDGDDYEKYDFLIDMENTYSSDGDFVYEQSLSFAATQFDTITSPYFFLKENELFTEYWDRVEDRLGKIRACLNIDGIAQPLPLFQPPIDPMALVNAAASGGGAASAAMAAGMSNVPDYRFSVLLRRAKDLTGKLKGFSDNLLSVLEKKDSEEMSLIQGKQEAQILELTTMLKEESILEAQDTLENLIETRQRAVDQEAHYAKLISEGYLPEEVAQMTMMGTAAVLHGVSTLGKYVAGLSYIVPQFTAGPFSFGVTSGGENIGAMMGQFGEAVQSAAEGLSMGGEIAGIAAQFKRSAQDWDLQQMMAASEIKQLDQQISAQEHRLAITKQELVMHQKEIENKASINAFMKNKFSNMQLYSWLSGKVSGLFFQTFKLAHDYAKQAEQAFVFEKGLKAGDVNHVGGMYWDSQKKGLLAGESLELDLDKMEKAYFETDSRNLEITKNISLLEIDPLALLKLKNEGACTFRLSEALFDYDFPGHYKRQIKTISLAFDLGEGQSVNATLTQLNNKLVMDTDIKAVKHLLDPANAATTNVRADWRANQQVALSHVDQYTENNGMFELNFGDERYLPFEGTGAVSNWRLELKGKKGSYNPADLLDVTIKLRYTAKAGGKRFESEVKGLLKPYHATSFFDMAYNFPDEWEAMVSGEVDDVGITFTREMFPNMSSSKIIGLFIRYEYEGGESGATFTINDDLAVPNNTYLQPNTLSVGQDGSEWKFMPKGDRSTLKNAEMVVVYKAKV